MNYRIRKATPEDVAEIVELSGELAEFERAEYSTDGKAGKLAALLFAENPWLYCLIAEGHDGAVLGFATYMVELSTWEAAFFVHLDCLYLRAHARNFGIGEQLMKIIARQAKEWGCRQVQWQTPIWNQRGIDFYHRLGATSRDKLRCYLDEATIEKLAN